LTVPTVLTTIVKVWGAEETPGQGVVVRVTLAGPPWADANVASVVRTGIITVDFIVMSAAGVRLRNNDWK
jgi:hypothetical protein